MYREDRPCIERMIHNISPIYSGITSDRVLDGELLYTNILEVNLFAFACKPGVDWREVFMKQSVGKYKQIEINLESLRIIHIYGEDGRKDGQCVERLVCVLREWSIYWEVGLCIAAIIQIG